MYSGSALITTPRLCRSESTAIGTGLVDTAMGTLGWKLVGTEPWAMSTGITTAALTLQFDYGADSYLCDRLSLRTVRAGTRAGDAVEAEMAPGTDCTATSGAGREPLSVAALRLRGPITTYTRVPPGGDPAPYTCP